MTAKLGELYPKVRLSKDRMPIKPLTQQQSRVRGEKALSPPPAKLGEGKKGLGGGKALFPLP